jgi:hypothetical protein
MIETVKPLSDILEELLREDQPPLTVGEITDRVARRGFGLFMIVLALPTLIPVLPPGSAAFIGLLYALLALQMLIGLDRPWLPRRMRGYRLGNRAVTALRTRGVSFLRRIERFSRPRAMVLDERIVLRLVAVVLLVLGVILFSPIPFLNTLPALSAMFLGVGLLNRDGLFLLIGVLLAVLVAAIIAFGGGILYGLFNDLLTWLRRP